MKDSQRYHRVYAYRTLESRRRRGRERRGHNFSTNNNVTNNNSFRQNAGYSWFADTMEEGSDGSEDCEECDCDDYRELDSDIDIESDYSSSGSENPWRDRRILDGIGESLTGSENPWRDRRILDGIGESLTGSENPWRRELSGFESLISILVIKLNLFSFVLFAVFESSKHCWNFFSIFVAPSGSRIVVHANEFKYYWLIYKSTFEFNIFNI